MRLQVTVGATNGTASSGRPVLHALVNDLAEFADRNAKPS
jgi:hypothetical protein